MSYDLHIHRAENFLDAQEAPIPADEWRTFAAGQPQLMPAGDPPLGDEPLYTWGADGPTYMLYEGEISVTGCRDSHDIENARSIAVALGARLQGDDGEFYETRPMSRRRSAPSRSRSAAGGGVADVTRGSA